MSDKELDEILKEVKQRSAGGDAAAEETAAPAPAEEVEAPVEEAVAEETPAEEVEAPAEEAAAEEAPAEAVESAEENAEPQEEFSIEEEPVEAVEAEETPAETEAAEEAEVPEEGAIDILAVADDYSENESEPGIPLAQDDGKKKKKTGVIIGVIAALIVIALGVAAFLYFNGYFGKKPVESESTTQPTTAAVQLDKGTANPLTGVYGYNKNALGKRPVAVVVENEYTTESVRPQWGIADADMIMEGETEFSTRMLFFFADMNQIPDQVGPSRSARPPFIRFSQMWDSIFIHTGLSRSKDDYEGADTVFENENIDHINLLSQSEDGTYFGRDNTRKTAIEHTGYLNGKNAVKLIENNKIGTDLREERFTAFEFNDEDLPAGEDEGNTATFRWSERCPKKGVFTFDEAKGVYTTTDFDSKYGQSNLEVKTLIYLLDETEYIVKENYKHSGSSETYCDYHLAGGEGKIFSMGKSTDIKWSRENGQLVIKTIDGEDVKLNRGKIYIGYGSSNHGGSITAE